MNKERFLELAHIWLEETSFLSGGKDRHWACQEIIAAGPVVLPFVFELYQKPESGHWFIVLSRITGERVIADEDMGRIGAIRKKWIKWGIEKGYI